MVAVAPPKAVEPALPPVSSSEPDPAARAAEQRAPNHGAALDANHAPNKLQVSLDANAARFVQTLTDINTSETLRRYPSEAQLAYSRAVMAYLRAQLGR